MQVAVAGFGLSDIQAAILLFSMCPVVAGQGIEYLPPTSTSNGSLGLDLMNVDASGSFVTGTSEGINMSIGATSIGSSPDKMTMQERISAMMRPC